MIILLDLVWTTSEQAYFIPIFILAFFIVLFPSPGLCTFTLVAMRLFGSLTSFETFIWDWELSSIGILGDSVLWWRKKIEGYHYRTTFRIVAFISISTGALFAGYDIPENSSELGIFLASCLGYYLISLFAYSTSASIYRLFLSLIVRKRPIREVTHQIIKISTNLGKQIKAGRKVGTAFLLGDVNNVLLKSEQIVPNPFEDKKISIMNEDAESFINQLSKVDGVFIVDEEGIIQACGRFLITERVRLFLGGLGTRHRSAAGITKKTKTIAFVISETDGRVRILKKGKLVHEINPEKDIDYNKILEKLNMKIQKDKTK